MLPCPGCGFALWNPVATLASSDAGLYDDAPFPGRMLLSHRTHFDHLDEMGDDQLALFTADIARVSRALRSLPGVRRVNVAILGNQVSHVHAHLIPRRVGESNADRAPWDGAAPHRRLEPGLRGRLVALIADRIGNQ